MAGTPAASAGDDAVETLLASVTDGERRADARTLITVMTELTGEPAAVWGSGIIGFGSARYRYPSGHEGVTALACFAPRKQHLVIYLVGYFDTDDADDLARLGPHTTGKGCLYVKRLRDVDLGVLRSLVERSIRLRRDLHEEAVRPAGQVGQ